MQSTYRRLFMVILLTTVHLVMLSAQGVTQVAHLQGEMVGEVSQTTAILQSRLTAPGIADDGDLPAQSGWARFELANNDRFDSSFTTDWLQATIDGDGIVKCKVSELKAATTYYYRLHSGESKTQTVHGPVRSFHTLPPKDAIARQSFIVVTGMYYHGFHHGPKKYQGEDKTLGYPALVTIRNLTPDFFIGTGDNVYYDGPRKTAAIDVTSMRKKWHEQFVQPRFVDLFARVPAYWEKDDHDFRYDDSDNTSDKLPAVTDGLRIFREQVPVVDPTDSEAVTYRTFRAGRLLQIWLPENRDYRSPNLAPDDHQKTIWGMKQQEWLKRTLLESDATFRIIVSPTPMIGPDDLSKKDNHCDIGGFRHERDEFFRWARSHNLHREGLYFVCGDRHWQYHSIDPSGFEEFSSGALVDANTRLGRNPGDPDSTDPDALIIQPYTQPDTVGGFLHVVVEPSDDDRTATLDFNFTARTGKVWHQGRKTRRIE